MKDNEYVANNYNTLSDGDSARGSVSSGCYRVDECGESPSRCDLHVRREGNLLLYHCFSNSCACAKANGAVGWAKLGRDKRQIQIRHKQEVQRKEPKVCFIPKSATSVLPRHVVEYLGDNNVSKRYAVGAGLLWDGVSGKMLFPTDSSKTKGVYRCIAESNTEENGGIGYVARTKWLREGEISPIHLAGNTNTLYVVESLMSGMSLNERGLSCCVIFGINIDEGKLEAIKEIFNTSDVSCRGQYNEIILLPDPDVSNIQCRKIVRMFNMKIGKASFKKYSKKPRYVKELIEKENK